MRRFSITSTSTHGPRFHGVCVSILEISQILGISAQNFHKITRKLCQQWCQVIPSKKAKGRPSLNPENNLLLLPIITWSMRAQPERETILPPRNHEYPPSLIQQLEPFFIKLFHVSGHFRKLKKF